MVKIERWYFLKWKRDQRRVMSSKKHGTNSKCWNPIGGHFRAAFSGTGRERGEHVLIPFDLLKAGLHIQRCQNWKILLFNGKEERRAISSKEVIQNAEILFSVLQWQRDAVTIKAFPHTHNILNFTVLLIEPLFYLFEKNQKNYKWYKVWVHKECFFAICSWTVVPYFEDVFILILGEAWKTLGLKISLMAALIF